MVTFNLENGQYVSIQNEAFKHLLFFGVSEFISLEQYTPLEKRFKTSYIAQEINMTIEKKYLKNFEVDKLRDNRIKSIVAGDKENPEKKFLLFNVTFNFKESETEFSMRFWMRRF